MAVPMVLTLGNRFSTGSVGSIPDRVAAIHDEGSIWWTLACLELASSVFKVHPDIKIPQFGRGSGCISFCFRCGHSSQGRRGRCSPADNLR